MTEPRRARRRPGSPPLEAGVAPTEQSTAVTPGEPTQIPVAPDAAPAEPSAVEADEASKPMTADLTGRELGEIRTRNEATDRAKADMDKARLDADHAERLYRYAQEGLTRFIADTVRSHDLYPGIRYMVDLNSARIVPAQG